MNAKTEELRRFIKAEFEFTSFMEAFGKKIPRILLFDLVLRSDNELIWSIAQDAMECEKNE